MISHDANRNVSHSPQRWQSVKSTFSSWLTFLCSFYFIFVFVWWLLRCCFRRFGFWLSCGFGWFRFCSCWFGFSSCFLFRRSWFGCNFFWSDLVRFLYYDFFLFCNSIVFFYFFGNSFIFVLLIGNSSTRGILLFSGGFSEIYLLPWNEDI